MASSPPQAPSPEAAAVEEDDDAAADLPMTMAASVVLEHLPKDAHKALETAGELEQEKGKVHDRAEHSNLVSLVSRIRHDQRPPTLSHRHPHDTIISTPSCFPVNSADSCSHSHYPALTAT